MGAQIVLEKPLTEQLEIGIASHSLNHQAESGDAWTVEPISDGYVIGVVDGLGHGREAARAARRAVAAIKQSATDSLEGIMRTCHRDLKGSRGAAISLGRISLAEQQIEWVGVGNVEGLVVSPAAHPATRWTSETLVVRGGVVGYDLPHLQHSHIAFQSGAVLVFATDGIRQGFSAEVVGYRRPQDIADRIMAAYDRGTDDALVLVVQRIGGASDHNG